MENDTTEREPKDGLKVVGVYDLDVCKFVRISDSDHVYCECSHVGGVTTLVTDGEDDCITGTGAHVDLGGLTSVLVPDTFKSHLSNKKSQQNLREYNHISSTFREVNSS